MLAVIGLGAVLWGLGAGLGVRRRARLAVLVVLLAAVILLHLALPDGHPLRVATGGSAVPWLYLAAIAGIVGVYAAGLGALRRRARPVVATAADLGAEMQKAEFSEAELRRYARHIVLRELGGPGQRKLKQAKVLVVGAGGLGSPVLLYLAAGGVGTIGVIDDDVVDLSNLQRQVIHGQATLGMPKVFSAQKALADLNPQVTLRPYHRRLTADIAPDLIAGYDLVLDGCDDFATRALVNRTCFAAGVPLISGAIAQWEGQLSLFDPARGGPCYACLFPAPPAPGSALSCVEGGVVGPLPGVIGAMMALEAIKRICDIGASLQGVLLIYDGLWGETRRIALTRTPGCPVCGAAPASEAP